MYKTYLFIISLICFFSCTNDNSKSSLLLDSKMEESINSLINDMTIEEKALDDYLNQIPIVSAFKGVSTIP